MRFCFFISIIGSEAVDDMDFFSSAALLHASNHRVAFSEHVFRWLKDMKVKICNTSAGNLVSLACTLLGALCTLDSSWITPVWCGGGKRLTHRSHEKVLVPHWNFKWVKVSLWKSIFPKSIMKFWVEVGPGVWLLLILLYFRDVYFY